MIWLAFVRTSCQNTHLSDQQLIIVTPDATRWSSKQNTITVTMKFLSHFWFITVMAWIPEACNALSSSSGSASKHTLYDVPVSNNGVKKKSHRVAVLSRYRTSLTVFFLHFMLGSLSHNFVQKGTAGIWSKGSISCWSRRFQVRCLLGGQSTRKSSRTPVPWYQSMSRGIWYMCKIRKRRFDGWSIKE